MKLEKSVIEIKISEEEELYNKFDCKKETLSDEFVNYITEKMSIIPVYKQIVLEIDTKNDIDLQQFEICFENYINKEIEEIKKKIKFNNIKKIRLFIIGLIFIILSIALSNIFNTIIIELLSIIGSFAIWEMTDLMLLANRDLKLRKLNLQREQKTEIIKKIEKKTTIANKSK